jgi:hypothetical protein
MDLMVLLDGHALDTNLYFLHRGVLGRGVGLATTSITSARRCL